MIILDTILFWVVVSIIIFGGIFIDFFFISQIVYGIRSMIIYRRNFHKELKSNCKKLKIRFGTYKITDKDKPHEE